MLVRALTAISTLVVAIVVALAVPVSQLRTVAITQTCCCPDPTHCHCPDHEKPRDSQPSMRACHRTTTMSVAPQLPEFTAPVIAIAPAPIRVIVAIAGPLAAPHPAPLLPRPDAPS